MTTRKLPRQPIAQPASVGKDYQYDRETGDFACYYDGIYIGSTATASAAEARLDAHAYAVLSHQPQVLVTRAIIASGGELDSPEELAIAEAQALVDAAIAANDKPDLSAAAEALVGAIADRQPGGREALRPEAAGELAAALARALDTEAETTETPSEIIRRVDIFDALCTVVDEARERHARDPKRLERIDRAWGWLLEEERYAVFGDWLQVSSASLPGKTYYASAQHCTCPAFGSCWHREAVDLFGRARADHDQAQQRAAQRGAARRAA